MAEFKITKIGYNPVTCVPDNFIETYMPAANGDYVKVYLYLLYCVKNGKMLSVSSLADYFQCTESDITRALKYWESQDLLSMEELVSMEEPDTLAQTETSPSIPEKHGYTAAEICRRILDSNGLYHVRIEHISGNLTDHFDPSTNVVRLSDTVYGSRSVASIGVAAHEVGHAIQYAVGYAPIRIRAAIIPITNFGSKLSMPLILLGFVFQWQPIVNLGIILFSLMTLFQLVTLPVEFNASRRAMDAIEGAALLTDEEQRGAGKVLRAAALTYVAALLMSLLQLLRSHWKK